MIGPRGWATILAALCIGLAASASRAQDYATAPMPGPPRPLTIDAPIEQRLSNGLRVVLARRPGVQIVTAQLVVLSGAEADPPRLAGLASMTAALLTKGTRHHSAPALARAAESLGGALDSSAGWHESEVAITVTVPQLDAALALVAETVREARFAPAELERLRLQLLDDLKVEYARPETLAALAAQRLVFGRGAYGHPAGGTPGSLRRIGRADLLALHAEYYRPDNSVLVLAGDLDADAALTLARRHFGSWRAAPRRIATPAATVADEAPTTTAVIEMPQAGQAAIVLAVPLPRLGPDRATAAVMNEVLGGGYSSRLNQEIRIHRGLSYGVHSGIDARLEGAALRVAIQTKNESAAEVVALLQAELDRLGAQPVGATELAARRAALIGDFGRGLETTAGLGAAVKALIVAGLAPTDLPNRIAALGAVTADQIQHYAAAHLGATRRRVVVAGEAPQFAGALRAIAPDLLSVPLAEFDPESQDAVAPGRRGPRK
jgi:zinc protease